MKQSQNDLTPFKDEVYLYYSSISEWNTIIIGFYIDLEWFPLFSSQLVNSLPNNVWDELSLFLGKKNELR